MAWDNLKCERDLNAEKCLLWSDLLQKMEFRIDDKLTWYDMHGTLWQGTSNEKIRNTQYYRRITMEKEENPRIKTLDYTKIKNP